MTECCIEPAPGEAPAVGEDGQPIEGAAPVQLDENGQPIPAAPEVVPEPEPEVIKTFYIMRMLSIESQTNEKTYIFYAIKATETKGTTATIRIQIGFATRRCRGSIR